MIIRNTTKISEELIKAIALDVGLDLKGEGVLEIEYKVAIKGICTDGNNGGFFKYADVYCIVLNPWVGCETLAHEMRHAAQCQAMGWDAMHEVYTIENEIEGYEGNVLEEDAREAGRRWKV